MSAIARPVKTGFMKVVQRNSAKLAPDWETIQRFGSDFRQLAVKQIVSHWKRNSSGTNHAFLWGEEIEYLLVKLTKGTEAKALLEQRRILQDLAVSHKAFSWQAEYGRCSLESMPQRPYGPKIEDLLDVEPSLRERRNAVKRILHKDEAVLTIPNLPCLGVQRPYTEPHYPPSEQPWAGKTLSDEMITDWKHTPFLMRHNLYCRRRNERISVHIPVFHDNKSQTSITQSIVGVSGPREEVISNNQSLSESQRSVTSVTQSTVSVEEPKEGEEVGLDSQSLSGVTNDYVEIDDFSYGPLQFGLQITLQAKDLEQARHLYDQLIPLTPVMIALTAATPIYKNMLVNTDSRWNVLKGVIDDQTPEEIETACPTTRSRWTSCQTYLGRHVPSEYANRNLKVDDEVLQSLMSEGMDVGLARHFAHVLSWDPLKLMTEDILDPDPMSTKVFDAYNVSLWQALKFKPPATPSNNDADGTSPGWRIEFRTPEVQLTDFENAAVAIFVNLAARVIVEFDLQLYIPLVEIEENFERAHSINAVVKEKFCFRTTNWRFGAQSSDLDGNIPGAEQASAQWNGMNKKEKPHYDLQSINHIINGSSQPSNSPTMADTTFPGFRCLIDEYIARRNPPPRIRAQISRYLDFISKRASGEVPTAATWMRKFVRGHRDYRFDSVVPESACWELLKAVEEMG